MTGVGRYGYEITKELLAFFPDLHLVGPPSLPQKWFSELPIQKIGLGRGAFWEQCVLPLFLRKMDSPLLINFANTSPLVYSNSLTVIHDFFPLTNPSWFSVKARLYYHLLLPQVIRRSRFHVFVSENTRTVKKTLFPQEQNIPSTVILNGKRTHWAPDKRSIPPYDKFILTVSSRDPRKNHERLIHAFIQAELDEYTLVIVGKKHASFSHVKTGAHPRVVYTGYVNDTVLHSLYSHASVFIYPSLDEGFGTPPLEAMACHCPVIASDIPVFRELHNNAVYYCNPYSTKSMSDALQKMVFDESLRKEYIERGKKKLLEFSWKKSAKQFIDIIEKLTMSS